MFNKILCKSEQKFTSDRIQECKRDQKALFRISKQLLGETRERPMPKRYTKQELPNQFGKFFFEKIKNIRQNLETCKHDNNTELSEHIKYTGKTTERVVTPLQELEPPTTEE